MIKIKLEIELEHLEQVKAMLEASDLIQSFAIEDPDDQNLKSMTATEFYKRINAANLAQQEQRLISQEQIEQEVNQW